MKYSPSSLVIRISEQRTNDNQLKDLLFRRGLLYQLPITFNFGENINGT
ncbi:MAG TPA: hypothetical protein V6D09_18310 [Leptolyngbyaceae cyanobacterium]